jgi:ABC-2 type transport system ATP-binding protein
MGRVLEASGLVKAFKGKRAVDGVDLTVGVGERVALLGPNGAGKTTTLLMVLGAIAPDTGTIDLLGHRLPKGRSQAMESVGFAAGYLPLPDRLRVKEILGVFAELSGVDDPGPAVQAGLARFRIAHLADQMGQELSSGQRTLVGIVKATLHRPRLLVLDEPTASLDPDVAHRVREGLERICDEDGTALLVTSHNMTDVERICERVVFIAAGRVVANGSPTEVAAGFGLSNLDEVFRHVASRWGEGGDI